jgi:hypothetical protein
VNKQIFAAPLVFTTLDAALAWFGDPDPRIGDAKIFVKLDRKAEGDFL